ncbi:MAG TPA: hypothetical protein VHY35_19555 [Stellaceae bacterium]|nr:hypothetical protein [Stellaceae bacterium]
MLKTLRFLNMLFVALTFGLTWCHVMEIPGKLRLDGSRWLDVQHNLYVAFGPPLGAPIEIAAIALCWLVYFLVRRRGPAAGWTLAAACCTTIGLGLWFWLVAPMNAVIAGWTTEGLPADWASVRNQWEAGQAAHAVMFGVGFGSLVAALLTETPR